MIYINSDIAHLFLSLDLRKNLFLLTMFARLTSLVVYYMCDAHWMLGLFIPGAIPLMRA